MCKCINKRAGSGDKISDSELRLISLDSSYLFGVSLHSFGLAAGRAALLLNFVFLHEASSINVA